jgi:NADH-quinone oxidoreductase subunit J
MMTTLLFVGFSALLLISAFLVITLQHPVKSALFLVVCFFAATGLWLMLTAEFLALILILVYVGAVMTLFLFVVMTLSVDIHALKQPYLKIYLPVGLLITALLTVLLMVALQGSDFSLVNNMTQASLLSKEPNTIALGKVLYTQYVLAFEIAGVILLVAMIAAISLTLHGPIKRKQQSIDAQVSVKREDRVRLVK